jgi:hypothetical protein
MTSARPSTQAPLAARIPNSGLLSVHPFDFLTSHPISAAQAIAKLSQRKII